VIPIWINLGIYDEPSQFFCSMVTSCLKELFRLKLLDASIHTFAKNNFNEKNSWNDKYHKIQDLFEEVKRAGYHLLFIIDEFDHARDLFKNKTDIQKFRELSYRVEWRVTYITLSRRRIHEIETQSKTSTSILSGILPEYFLREFNDEDMEEYYKRYQSIGMELTSQFKQRINYFCGRHPFLLDVLGYELTEFFKKSQRIDVDIAIRLSEHTFINYYQHILKILEEENSLNKLLQILFGPVVDVKETDLKRFLDYGILKKDNKENYVVFSEHFYLFLNIVQREVELWPLWSKTERRLRQIIETAMTNEYGEFWITRFEKMHQDKREIFERCRDKKGREDKLFGGRSSHYIIDYAYPQDLFAIIFAEWKIFRSSFGKDTNYWDQHKQLLAKIRTPLAHSRADALTDHEKKTAEGYCKEILSISIKDIN
jgi:hypothetical protein